MPGGDGGFGDGSNPSGWRSAWRLVGTIFGLAVVVLVFAVVVPRLAPYDEVFAAIGNVAPGWLVAIGVLGVTNLVAAVAAQAVALPGLSIPRAALADWASTALANLFPGGTLASMGLTWSMYRSWGHEDGPIARAMVATGILDNLVKLAAPLLAVLWLATETELDGRLIVAAVLGGVMFLVSCALMVVIVGRRSSVERLGFVLDRLPVIGGGWVERLDEWRRAVLELAEEVGVRLSLVTVLGHANLCFLLWACLRGTGVSGSGVTAAGIFGAFAFGRLVTAIPITPGGLGVAELGLIGALVQVGSIEEAAVVPGVLLFRFLSFAVPVPLGGVAWAVWSLGRARKA